MSILAGMELMGFAALLCAIPFVLIALVPLSIAIFNVTLWLRNRRSRD
jgi:hypothetical protein